ncbi:dihydrodipicolinate synthase family protein [Thalassomonas viridans]|uniref:Dihydrodipicolinate synthase family protein n=1 Tax=Thalassomonas viridans TaxID=137584 RepID=A0AAE9Z5M8_9GAMM|nr:dihydrodipicolinate synthase family protein [Thalassomonas viridans]WDE07191.1 dihydrodipicolinate synthase family protein [Thalassomonas viridans]
MKFQGIYTPVITTFDQAGNIDYTAWKQVLDKQIESGVHGLIIGGSTGEFYGMTKAERLEQFAFANEYIAGRIPWIAGVNDMLATEAYQYAAAAKAAGADAMLVAAPPYSLPDEQELAQHIIRIDEAADLPIILYNYPDRTGVEMGTQCLDLIADRPNIVAIKESSGDVNRIHQLTLDYPQVQLSAGAEDQVLEFFVWGAQSWVCACANIFPRACVAFYEACVLEKDFAKGQKFMAALMPVMEYLEQSGKFVQCVKLGAKLQGLTPGPVRLPMLELDDEMSAQVTTVIQTAAQQLEELMAS